MIGRSRLAALQAAMACTTENPGRWPGLRDLGPLALKKWLCLPTVHVSALQGRLGLRAGNPGRYPGLRDFGPLALKKAGRWTGRTLSAMPENPIRNAGEPFRRCRRPFRQYRGASPSPPERGSRSATRSSLLQPLHLGAHAVHEELHFLQVLAEVFGGTGRGRDGAGGALLGRQILADLLAAR